MKKNKRLGISLLFLVMMFMIPFADIAGSNQTVMAKAEITVYVTRTGSKYHTHKCGNGNFYASSLSSAKARGLSACSKCFPNGAPGSSSGTGGNTTVSPPKKVIKINATEKVLIKGQTYNLKITGTSKKVTWKSSKKSVVTVNSSGKITAKKKGTAVITAKIGTVSKKCKVTVEAPKLSETSITLAVTKKKTIKLLGCTHSVKWSSSNSSVAKVKNGTITASYPGNATITAEVHGKKFKCKVKVNPPKITAISLSSNKLSMDTDTYKTLQVKVSPSNALKYYEVSAKSSNEHIVSIDEIDGGRIELESYDEPGSANITVKVGNQTLVCKVTVLGNTLDQPEEDIPVVERPQTQPQVTSVTFTQSNRVLEPNGTCMLFYSVSPYRPESDYNCVWKSSDESIVTVERTSNGVAYLRAGGKEGAANITLTVGKKSATCKVTVAKPEITSLSFSKTSVSLKPSESTRLWFNVDPFTADDYYDFSCMSSDEDIVKVVKVGSSIIDIKAGNKEGEASVTLTIGNKSAVCKVTVAKPPIISVSLNKEDVSMRTGGWALLFFDVDPFTSYNYYDYVWESSDEDIVKIESTSIGAAHLRAGTKTGIAYITLTVGDKKATCKVTVTN